MYLSELEKKLFAKQHNFSKIFKSFIIMFRKTLTLTKKFNKRNTLVTLNNTRQSLSLTHCNRRLITTDELKAAKVKKTEKQILIIVHLEIFRKNKYKKIWKDLELLKTLILILNIKMNVKFFFFFSQIIVFFK